MGGQATAAADGRQPRRGRMTTLIIEGCAIVTMDGQRTEHASGYVVIEGNRITAVGPGSAARPGQGGARPAATQRSGG